MVARWPEPQVGPNRTEPGRLIPVTEAERREVFLRAIGNDYPLMDLILKCIDNHPQTRAHASEIVERLAEMVLQFPVFFANRLEMLRQITQIEEEKRVLNESTKKQANIIKEKEIQFASPMENVQTNEQREAAEVDRLKWIHASEVEQLQLRISSPR